MSTYRDLLDRRVQADARQTIVVQVCLDPDLLVELDAARHGMVPAARRSIGDAGGVPEEATARLGAAEAAVRAATIHVTLSTLSADELLAAQADMGQDTPMATMWKRHLAAAFRAVRDGNGTPVDDIDRERWAVLLDVVPAGELQTWHGRLSKAGQAPDFPTSARS